MSFKAQIPIELFFHNLHILFLRCFTTLLSMENISNIQNSEIRLRLVYASLVCCTGRSHGECFSTVMAGISPLSRLPSIPRWRMITGCTGYEYSGESNLDPLGVLFFRMMHTKQILDRRQRMLQRNKARIHPFTAFIVIMHHYHQLHQDT